MANVVVPSDIAEELEEKLFTNNIDFYIDSKLETPAYSTYVVEKEQVKRTRDFLRRLNIKRNLSLCLGKKRS